MLIESIMTSNVFSVTPDMTVKDAIVLITSKKISGAPIVDQNGAVVSVVTEGDLLKLAAAGFLQKSIESCLPKLPSTDDLKTLKRTTPFAEAYRSFLANPFHRLIVTDDNGKLIGVVSRSNVLKVLIGDVQADAGPDEADHKKAV